jgi:S-adenosylmethionine:tRNA ribosyltransferase-isomerase
VTRDDDPLAPYDYALPPERIAQRPPPERDAARLMVLPRSGALPVAVEHARVADLPRWLRPGDLLVVNATRVLPARLRGAKATGGAAEALLLEPLGEGRFAALVRARGKLRVGAKFRFGPPDSTMDSEIVELGEAGRVTLAFEPGASPYEVGEAPLPPYIRRARAQREDLDRYQTVYAREPGAVAAPTAGLHLTDALLDALRVAGVETAEVVLHVGAGTFRPVGACELREGRLHAERYALPAATADAVVRARARGGRVVAVGTTTARVLETRAQGGGLVRAGAGRTDLFLRPGSRFRAVDALITNFHLPRSSLLLLVAAFAGRERILDAYRQAVAAGYRFYSYGDAMLIL